MTKEEFTNKLRALSEETERDAEFTHGDADLLIIQWLRDTGCEEAADIFEKMERWYG